MTPEQSSKSVAWPTRKPAIPVKEWLLVMVSLYGIIPGRIALRQVKLFAVIQFFIG